MPDDDAERFQQDDETELRELQVTILPQDVGGVWANFARVSHSPHEFTIDFVRIDFATAPLMGMVVARVAVSPLFVMQLIAALNENWDTYAKRAMPKGVYEADEPGSRGGPSQD